MSDRIEIGRCKDCSWRGQNGYYSRPGYCCNTEKIREDFHEKKDEEGDDRLLYDYDEGGGFWVGPNFGCVHWTKKQTP